MENILAMVDNHASSNKTVTTDLPKLTCLPKFYEIVKF